MVIAHADFDVKKVRLVIANVVIVELQLIWPPTGGISKVLLIQQPW